MSEYWDQFAGLTRMVPKEEIKRLVGPAFQSIENGQVVFETALGNESISLLAFSFKPDVAEAIVQYKIFVADMEPRLRKCRTTIEELTTHH